MARAVRIRSKTKPAKPKAKPRAKSKAKPKQPAAKRPAKRPAAKQPATPRARKRPAPPPIKPGTPVGREELLAVLAKIAPRLAADPIYHHESNAPFDLAELERYLTTIPPRTTLEQLFGGTLQGMIQSVRYSALHVVREVFRDDKQALITTRPTIVLAKGESLAVVGDLVVEGDLLNGGILVVTGDLTIRGAYLGPAFDYSLAAVGGTLRAHDVSTSGEILVGDRLEATRLVHLQYNDYSSILPSLKTRALAIDDNFPALGSVETELQIDDHLDADQLHAVFGQSAPVVAAIAAYDGNESPIRALIRG